MADGSTGRAHRLEEKLAADARRRKRREAADVLVKIGGTVAAACDRFTLHQRDPGLRAVVRWIQWNGNGYSGRKPDVVVPVVRTDRVTQVRDLVRRHRLEGWCVLFQSFAVGRDGFEWAIGLDVSEVTPRRTCCSPRTTSSSRRRRSVTAPTSPRASARA